MVFRVSSVRSAGNRRVLKGQCSVSAGLFLLGKADPAPHMRPSRAAAVPREAAFGEAAAEPSLRLWLLAGVPAPALVGGVEILGVIPMVSAYIAAVGDEAGELVHLRAVLSGGLAHLLGGPQAFALPLEATSHHPGEDAGQLPAELLGQLAVSLLRRDGHRPGDEPDPTPDRVVGPADLGLVVGGEPELVSGPEVEPLRPHEPRGYGVLAGQILDK